MNISAFAIGQWAAPFHGIMIEVRCFTRSVIIRNIFRIETVIVKHMY